METIKIVFRAILIASWMVFPAVAFAKTPLAELQGDIPKELRELMVAAVGAEDDPPRSLAQARRRVQKAAEQGIAVLRSQGYYAGTVKARVDEYVSETEGSKPRPPKAFLEITTGPRFTFSEINLTYDGATPDIADQIPAEIALKKGEPAVAARVIAGELRALAYLRAHGYPETVIKPSKHIVDHDTKTLRVEYIMFAGDKTRFGELNQTGTAYLIKSWPRMISPFEEGDVFDERKLNKLAARVTGAGVFDGATAVLSDEKIPNPDGTVTRNVVLDVEQGAINTVSGEVGFSTTDGSGVEVAYERRNFIGYAQTLTLTTTAKTNQLSFGVDYNVPYLWRVDRELDLSAIISREDTDAFTGERLTLSAEVTQILSSRFKIAAGVGFEASRFEEEGEEVNSFLVDGLGRATYDARDSILDPVTGYQLELRVDPSYNFGSEDGFFTTVETSASAYKRVSSKLVAAGRVTAGTIFGADQSSVPLNRRFYSGGGGSVRGFGFQTISPVDSENDPIGGRSLSEASAELRYRGESPIGFAAFVDAGSVTNSTLPDLSDIRYGAGVGLRYYTSFAPLRADIAFPINKRSSDNAVQLYISIGQAF